VKVKTALTFIRRVDTLPFTLYTLHFLFLVALVFLPLPYAVGLVAGVGILLLAVIDPLWAVGAVLLAVPIQERFVLPGGLSFTWAAVGLLAGSLGLHILVHPEKPVRPGRVFVPLLLLVWVFGFATSLTPYSQSEGLKETARWASVLLIYLGVVLSFDRAATPAGRCWRAMLLALFILLGPAASGLVGLRQFVTGDGPPSFAIAGGDFVRAYGTIGQPNSFAGYMNMAWPLAAGLLLVGGLSLISGWIRGQGDKGTRGQDVAMAMLNTPSPPVPHFPLPLVAAFLAVTTLLGGIIGAGLAASFSRGGWLGAAGGGAVVVLASALLLPPFLRSWAIRMLGAGVVVGVLALALGAGGLLPDALAQRLTSITRNLRLFDVRTVEVNPENFAVVERMAHLQAGWRMLERYPLSGVGPGSYTLAYEATAAPGSMPIALHPWYASRGHAHNYYLHIAAEAGLPGLLVYLVLLGVLGYTALRALQRAQGWLWRGLAVGASGIVASVASHNLFEHLHVLNMGLQVGAVWGLLVVVERYGGKNVRISYGSNAAIIDTNKPSGKGSQQWRWKRAIH
jgi:O-antigen ligase